ncbi:predicted protein [Histoplasma mississippiense (nom. inval.)]|uniref:predicted protein n=1 Tax=Ajellomyces capsulatus (strain NAm1 / WU24) TaxID=2059318 RepID=UPI000157D437|nr:predicted protein [Histoplasma mississippiense (nom. inval.)]EDN05203.1 predicted protein [Histoplasma mississippiense (nom. inval.)]
MIHTSRPFQLERHPAPRRGLFYHPLANTAQRVLAFDQLIRFNYKKLMMRFPLTCNQLEETHLGYSHIFLNWTDLVLRYSSQKLQSEKDLENYERTAVENHVHDTIAELCKIPGARERDSRFGDGVVFELCHGYGLETYSSFFLATFYIMTLAVRGVVELFKLVEREEAVNWTVRMYSYYAVIKESNTSFYRHPIKTFDLPARWGKNKWSAYIFTKNVYNTGMPDYLRRIKTAVDEIPHGTAHKGRVIRSLLFIRLGS